MPSHHLSMHALRTLHPNSSSQLGSESTTTTQLPVQEYELPSPPPPTRPFTMRLRDRVSTTWSRLTGNRQINDDLELGALPGSRAQSVNSHTAQGPISNPPSLSNQPIHEGHEEPNPHDGTDNVPLAPPQRAVQVSRRKLLHATPIVVEISTAIDFPSDSEFVIPLRDQIAGVLGRNSCAIYLSIEQPKVVLYGHSQETFLAKVTALKGALRVDDGRLCNLQRVLCDTFKVHPFNGLVQFTYLNEKDLAVGSRTMHEHVGNRFRSTSYRQPIMVPSSEDLCNLPSVVVSDYDHEDADPSHAIPVRFTGSGFDIQYADGAFTRPARNNPLGRRQQSPAAERNSSPAASESNPEAPEPGSEAPDTAQPNRESSDDEITATRRSSPFCPPLTEEEYNALTDLERYEHELRKQERWDRRIRRYLDRTAPVGPLTEENPDDVIEEVGYERPQVASSSYSSESGGAGQVQEETESHPASTDVFGTYITRGLQYPEPEPRPKPESRIAKAIRKTTGKLPWKRGRSKTVGATPDNDSPPPMWPTGPTPTHRLLAVPETPSHALPAPPSRALIRGRPHTESPVTRLARRFHRRGSRDVLPVNAPGNLTTASVETSGTARPTEPTGPAESTEPEQSNPDNKIRYA